MARDFPQLWARFLRETYGGNAARIMQVFGCSERCVRKWLTAEGGANGDKLLIAARTAPAAFQRLIIAAE